MNNNKSWKDNLVYDCEKFSAWRLDEKDRFLLPGACIEIHMESETMYESRVYGMANAIDVKILSKQNIKSGAIEIVVLKQDAVSKTVLGRKTFKDADSYAKSIKEFEFILPYLTKSVTTKEEYAQSMKFQ